MNLSKLSLPVIVCMALSSCQKQAAFRSAEKRTATSSPSTIKAAALTTTIENFETGTKTAYAAGNVTLSTGVWNFNDALIGNLTTDHKNGGQSARIRNSGTITMEFDLTGASSVTVQHAVFGSDGSSTWYRKGFCRDGQLSDG